MNDHLLICATPNDGGKMTKKDVRTEAERNRVKSNANDVLQGVFDLVRNQQTSFRTRQMVESLGLSGASSDVRLVNGALEKLRRHRIVQCLGGRDKDVRWKRVLA